MELIKVKDKPKWYTDDCELTMHIDNWELCIDKVGGFSIPELVEFTKTKIESGFIGSEELSRFSPWVIKTTIIDDKPIIATISMSQYVNQLNPDCSCTPHKMDIAISIILLKHRNPVVTIAGAVYISCVDEILKCTLPSGSNYTLSNSDMSVVKENPFLTPAGITIAVASKKGTLGLIYDHEAIDISGKGIIRKVAIPENLSSEDGIAFVNTTLSKMVIYPTSHTVTSQVDTYKANKSIASSITELIEFLTMESTFCIVVSSADDMHLRISLEYL